MSFSSRNQQVDGADGKAAAQVLVDIATAPLAKAAAAAAAGGGKKGKRRTPLTRPLVGSFSGENDRLLARSPVCALVITWLGDGCASSHVFFGHFCKSRNT